MKVQPLLRFSFRVLLLNLGVFMIFRPVLSVTAFTCAAVCLTGCGAATAPTTPAAVTVTASAPAATVTQTVTESPTASPTTSKAAAAPTPAAVVKVPNGVGLNYQQAQDLWRGNGLVVGIATDATGAHRLPVIDSNWVVLAQSIPAGSSVDVGTEIVATVKKYSDG